MSTQCDPNEFCFQVLPAARAWADGLEEESIFRLCFEDTLQRAHLPSYFRAIAKLAQQPITVAVLFRLWELYDVNSYAVLTIGLDELEASKDTSEEMRGLIAAIRDLDKQAHAIGPGSGF